jgi:beta-carotene hydroxylase
MPTTPRFHPPPRLSELGLDLLKLTAAQRALTLGVPFIFAGIYFYGAFLGHWILAVGAVVYLSFVTYGSTSHDLVHGNLGLASRTNEFFLSLIELLALRSGHAYRLSHLHHHAHFPEDSDLEAAASKKSFTGALLEGVTFHFRLWRWAIRRAEERERAWILCEGVLAALLMLASVLVCRTTIVPLVYVLLMITGAWITPLITSYVPHNPAGKTELEQTRVFRGVVLSLIAMEHLYHLEHHLYPAVPHQNWATLAKRLDPYLAEQGIKPIKLLF